MFRYIKNQVIEKKFFDYLLMADKLEKLVNILSSITLITIGAGILTYPEQANSTAYELITKSGSLVILYEGLRRFRVF